MSRLKHWDRIKYGSILGAVVNSFLGVALTGLWVYVSVSQANTLRFTDAFYFVIFVVLPLIGFGSIIGAFVSFSFPTYRLSSRFRGGVTGLIVSGLSFFLLLTLDSLIEGYKPERDLTYWESLPYMILYTFYAMGIGFASGWTFGLKIRLSNGPFKENMAQTSQMIL
jgi:hypothetical protein